MNLKLSPLFSDGMVLQRNEEIFIRGLAAPEDTIEISFRGSKFKTAADREGFWSCSVGEYPESCEPSKMQIVTDKGEIANISDILLGDVWVCSGQSNMEFMLSRTAHNYPFEMDKVNPHIRQLKVPHEFNFKKPIEDYEMGECKWEKFNAAGTWQEFTPRTAPNFTAIGYFFAKMLYERYGVPIGLFACAVGGVPISAWMSREMLDKYPEELAVADERDDAFIEKTNAEFEVYTSDYHTRLWEADEGFKQGFMKEAFDDADWDEVSLFSQLQGSGSYWYRKTVEIPEDMKGKKATIFLGTAVDMDETYVDGKRIGQVTYRYPPREYEIKLPKDKDTITIAIRLLLFFGGKGGFTPGKNCFISTGNRCIDLNGAWKRMQGATIEENKPQIFFHYTPTGLYNGMTAPLFKYPVKGMLWCQGESNADKPDSYADKLMKMIEGIREARKQENLPFIMSQLTYYDDAGNMGINDWDEIRKQQKIVLALPNTGLACAYDLGEHNDLHPQNKRDVGERMARLAMRIAYGEELPPNMFEMCNAE